MATTTPNYGWAVPTSTDLVKDGATAIETLGDAIDASMNTALGTKKAGMVLLNTTSFSAVASQSINDVFSTTYDNYKLHFIGTTSTENTINLRMRVAGADNSTSNYYFQRTISKDGNNVTGSEALATTSWAGFNTNTTNSIIEVEMFSPFLATATTFLGRYEKVETLATVHETATLSGIHNVASSFTGVTYTVGGGTMSGTISVYAYNK